jgi:hypothetical protein
MTPTCSSCCSTSARGVECAWLWSSGYISPTARASSLRNAHACIPTRAQHNRQHNHHQPACDRAAQEEQLPHRLAPPTNPTGGTHSPNTASSTPRCDAASRAAVAARSGRVEVGRMHGRRRGSRHRRIGRLGRGRHGGIGRLGRTSASGRTSARPRAGRLLPALRQ